LTRLQYGVITSPNYPEKYSDSNVAGNMQCHWFIHVRVGYQILLHFETFEVEGNPNGEWNSRTGRKNERPL